MVKYYSKEFTFDEFQNANILWATKNLLSEANSKVVEASVPVITAKVESTRLGAAVKFVEENIDSHSDILGLSFVYLEVQAHFFRSFFLSSSGFYKEAIYNLRSALELSLFYSSEFSDNEFPQDVEEFLEHLTARRKKIALWLGSKRHTPGKREFFRNFRKRKSISDFLDGTDFSNDLDELSGKLNSYVHTQGFEFSNFRMYGTSDSGLTLPPKYVESQVLQFLDLFTQTVELVGVLMVATKPVLLDEEFSARLFESMAEVPDGLWGRSAKNFFALVNEHYKNYFLPFWTRLPDLGDETSVG